MPYITIIPMSIPITCFSRIDLDYAAAMYTSENCIAAEMGYAMLDRVEHLMHGYPLVFPGVQSNMFNVLLAML